MADQEVQIAKRDAKGRMLEPLPGTIPFTQVTARNAAAKRWERYRRVGNEKLVEQFGKDGLEVETPADVYGLILAKQAKALHDAKDPKINDVEKLGRLMTGHASEEARRENGGGGAIPPGAIVAAPGALAELLTILERDKRAAIDKSQAIDAESNG